MADKENKEGKEKKVEKDGSSKKKKKEKTEEKNEPEWEELDASIIKGRLVLTDEQKEILEQFKVNVADCKRPYHDDGELCRWLVAREWDLKKATFMFTESMKWRTQEVCNTSEHLALAYQSLRRFLSSSVLS